VRRDDRRQIPAMTRPPAIDERGAAPASWLRGIGLLAVSALDASAAHAIVAGIDAPGWVSLDREVPGSRRVRNGLAIQIGVPRGLFSRRPTEPPITPARFLDATAVTSGWIQRRPSYVPAVVAVMSAAGGTVSSEPFEGDADGWLVIRVYPTDEGGSRIDVRGELDAPMERQVSAAIVALDAGLLRRWDPTAPEQSKVSKLLPIAIRLPAHVRRKRPARLR
jgi:hypothetical protein